MSTGWALGTGWALVLSALLLAANAFFVAAEFALVASKRYRLEQAAENGSRAARAALAGTRELSLMLAGAQLGITLATLGLGALAEPALAHLLEPALVALGLPARTSYLIGFVVALAVVVFAHMVLGEMAPKSWAISQPERSAILLALPFRGFARLVRPALAGLNALANLLLRLVRVRPLDQLAQAHGPQELSILLEQSREQGTLALDQHQLLASMLRLRQARIATVMAPLADLVMVAPGASAAEVERVCLASGRSRVAVADPDPVALVHVRDAVIATTRGDDVTAADLMQPALTLNESLTMLEAVKLMRDTRSQLALVATPGGALAGFVALEDLLELVIGEFNDETD